MKSIPHFLEGPHRKSIRLAMDEATHVNVVRSERGSLFMLLPRLLLHRPLRDPSTRAS